MLTVLLLIPFLGALLISVLPSEGSSERARTLSVITLVVQCVLSFALLLPFSAAEPGMQMLETLPWLPQVGLEFSLALDGLSLPLVLMNGVLCLVATLASRSISNRPRLYFALLLVISELGVTFFELALPGPVVVELAGFGIAPGVMLLGPLSIGAAFVFNVPKIN